ncbi:MAG: SDR family NAD(P)-dependent oxidoreductase [Myxococcota bacterium]
MDRTPTHVMVTGAEGALGSAVTSRLLEAGCQVVATTRKPVSTSQQGVRWVRMDVTDARSVQEALASLTADNVPLDGLVHCAGGFRSGPLDQLSDEDLDFLVHTNLRSALLLLRAVLPGMKARNFGRVVLVGSHSTLQPGANVATYVATKAALNALTQSLAQELRAFNINVNAVLPGTLDTPANRRDMPDADHAAWVGLDALSEIIFTLLQPATRPIHGALIPVAGRP